MLHFRTLSGLTDVFQSNLKRPLTCVAAGSRARYFGSGRPGLGPGQRRTPAPSARSIRGAPAAPRPPAHTQTRALCSKSDGSNEASKDSTTEKRRKAGILPSLEDLLFYTIAEGQERIPAHKFTTALKATGLRTGDPRLKECMEMLKVIMKTTSDGALDRHLFKKYGTPFCAHIDELYENAKKMPGGQP
ncbi:hypothetical protein CRUP_007313 [Coryphaenoides rupestris]|nr:hypothetical protein CRUP_007313 [Coryphaenoides rupestris]